MQDEQLHAAVPAHERGAQRARHSGHMGCVEHIRVGILRVAVPQPEQQRDQGAVLRVWNIPTAHPRRKLCAPTRVVGTSSLARVDSAKRMNWGMVTAAARHDDDVSFPNSQQQKIRSTCTGTPAAYRLSARSWMGACQAAMASLPALPARACSPKSA